MFFLRRVPVKGNKVSYSVLLRFVGEGVLNFDFILATLISSITVQRHLSSELWSGGQLLGGRCLLGCLLCLSQFWSARLFTTCL